MKEKPYLKIICSVVIILAVIGYFLFQNNRNNNDDSTSINISVIVINESNETIINDDLFIEYEINQKPTLLEVLQENYEITLTTGPFAMLIGIKKGDASLIITNMSNSYIAFYINDNYANYGLDEQPYADGDVIKLVFESF